MMYKPPIHMNESMSDYILKEVENELMLTVTRTVGFEVDREELLKALKYNREQYEKGYRDALRDQIHCEECLFERHCLWQTKNGFCHAAKRMDDYFD